MTLKEKAESNKYGHNTSIYESYNMKYGAEDYKLVPKQYRRVIEINVIDIKDRASKLRMVYKELGGKKITLFCDGFTVVIDG